MLITLFDRNREKVTELAKAFEGVEDVTTACIDLEHLPINDVLVTAGNSFGVMTGGIDLDVRNMYGLALQDSIQNTIMRDFAHGIPVGDVVSVEIKESPKHKRVLYTPTMERPKPIPWINIVYATFISLRVAHEMKVNTIAIPMLGAGVGMVSPTLAAQAMRVGYDAFQSSLKYGWEEEKENAKT